jgi:outer membrane protein OmpA-like peptidoglycan-associated protein
VTGPRAWLALAAVAVAVTGCGPRRVAAPAAPRDLIVLAPHPEEGPLGAAVVDSAGASTTLAEQPGASVTVTAGQPPPPPAVLPPADITRLFGDVLAIIPPPARRFVLFFELGGETLTAESRGLVPEILALVTQRGRPDVSVVGHTDTTGAADANVALGLRRATTVRDLLTGAGLEASLVDVASHGESNLLEPTADNVEHPRNRRVEVTVR